MSRANKPADPPAAAAPPATVLVKPVSARCNLRCAYCFYRDRPTDPYAGAATPTMSREVLAALVAQHLRLSPGATFAWQGGEPTLAGLDFFRAVVAYQARYGARGQIVANALQTNGLALDKDWARLLADYRFLVGLSLDGPQDVHDAWRSGPDGGSFADVMAALALLRRYRVETNILAVVHRHNAGDIERSYRFLAEAGQRFLQFVPVVDRLPGGGLTEWSLAPGQWGECLCRLFDLWYSGGSPEVSVRLFDNLVAVAAGLPAESCEMLPRCDAYYVVEHNGDVYPCDFFVAPEQRLGNLLRQPLRDVLLGEARERFAAARRRLMLPECHDCRWLHLCHGGCPRYRVDGAAYLCDDMRRFYDYAWGRIAAVAARLTAAQEAPGAAAAAPSHHQRPREG